jgi:DNA modification methylase
MSPKPIPFLPVMNFETHNVPGGVRIFQGHSLDILTALPKEVVQCCVTSPPYFGLRKYSEDSAVAWPAVSYSPMAGLPTIEVPAMICALGEETTVEAYVGHLVLIFRETRRVLKKDGTLWLNLGDSCANDGKWGGHSGGKHAKVLCDTPIGRMKRYTGLKPKDRIFIPHRVALALQADGWFTRMDNVWSKPNPLPESVQDRPTNAHEYIFLLSKSARYYYDPDAIAEPSKGWKGSTFDGERDLAVRPTTSRKPRNSNARPQRERAEQLARDGGLTAEHIEAIRSVGLSDTGMNQITQSGSGKNTAEVQRLANEAKVVLGGYYREFLMTETRNARSVWTIAPQRCTEAHFAVFPEEIPRRCIMAGSREGDLILDNFGGSGTTAKVARELGRPAILCEQNPEYVDIMKKRLRADQMRLFDDARDLPEAA